MKFRTYSGERTILMGCSVCGCAYEYPTEIRRTSDGLWRCIDNCSADKPTVLDEQRATAASRQKRDEVTMPVMGIKAGWHS